MNERFPRIELVPIERIRFHEAPERRRTLRLVERVRSDDRLKHPPLVAEMGAGADERELLLLDGANRVSAFAELGYREIPAQVVEYADPSVELSGWHHLLLEPGAADLRRAYSKLDGVRLERVSPSSLGRRLEFREVYAVWVDRQATPWALFPRSGSPSPAERMQVLTEVIAAYEGVSPLERIKLAEYDNLPEVLRSRPYELCLFPTLTKEELLRLVRESQMIPTGITRHLVPGRALGLNLDLAFMRSVERFEARARHLREHLDRLEVEGRIRFYEESVFILNE